MKTCTKCGETKPKSEFVNRSASKDGLAYRCKVCTRLASKNYAVQNKEKIILSRSLRVESARLRSKLWRENNKDRYAKQMKDYYEKNKELLKKRSIEWVKENKGRKIESDRNWRQSNKGKLLAYFKKYKVSKKNRTPKWLTFEHYKDIECFYEAALAFRLFTGNDYHVDHIVPLQGKTVSGLHVPANLQVLQSSENLKKSNLFWPDMW